MIALGHRHSCPWIAAILLLGLLFVVPTIVRADAPVTRGHQRMRVGSVEPSTLWTDVQPLPSLETLLRPARSELVQPGTVPGHTFTLPAPVYQDTPEDNSWISRVLNPGNWIMDAGMGISTGLLATMSDIVLATVHQLIDVPGGCIGVVFCTPESTLFDSAGVISVSLSAVWARLIPVAMLLLTCFFVVRVGQIAMAGPHHFGPEARNLVVMLIASGTLITQSGPFLRAMVTFFNAMNSAILESDGSRLLDLMLSRPPLNFGVILTQLLFFLVFLCLLFLGYLRLFKLFLLFALAPLMGALLMLPTQTSYFKNWINTLLALLVEQTVWVVAFMIGITLAMPGGAIPDISDPANNAETIRHFIGATIAIVIAVCSRSLFSSVFHALSPGGASFGVFRTLTTWHLARRIGDSLLARGSHTAGSTVARGTTAGHNARTGSHDSHAAAPQTGSRATPANTAARNGRNAAPGPGPARGAIQPLASSTAANGNGTTPVPSGVRNGQSVPGTRARMALGQRGHELAAPLVTAGAGHVAADLRTTVRPSIPAPPIRTPGGARIYSMSPATQRQPLAPLIVDVQPQPVSTSTLMSPVPRHRMLPTAQGSLLAAASEPRALPVPSTPPDADQSSVQQQRSMLPGTLSSRRRLAYAGVARPRATAMRHQRQGAPHAVNRRTRSSWTPGPHKPAAVRMTIQQRAATEEPATPPPSATRLPRHSQGTGMRYRPRTTTVRKHRPARVGTFRRPRLAEEQQPSDGPGRATAAERMRVIQRAMLRRRSQQFRRDVRKEEQ